MRAERLRVGSENTPNFVTFWPTLSKDDQEKIQVITSLMTLKVHHVSNFRELPLTAGPENKAAIKK